MYKGCFVLVMLVASTVAFSQQFYPAALVVGRINIPIDEDYGRRYYAQLIREQGNSVTAYPIANVAVMAEAGERLSQALDELRARDPRYFDMVMAKQGIMFMPNQSSPEAVRDPSRVPIQRLFPR